MSEGFELPLIEFSRDFECTILATPTPIGLAELVPNFLRQYYAHPDLDSLDPVWTSAARVGRALRAWISARRVTLGLLHKQALSASIPFDNRVYICLRDFRTEVGWWTIHYHVYWGNVADPNTDEDRFTPDSVPRRGRSVFKRCPQAMATEQLD